MKASFRIDDIEGLRADLEDLPRATQRNVLKRTGLKAMKRVEDRAKELAPSDDGDLRDSITTQAVKARRVSSTRYATANGVEVATGPTGREEGGNAAWQEFGTIRMAANPYMRPAADAEGEAAVRDLGLLLGDEIGKAVARIARKAARRG